MSRHFHSIVGIFALAMAVFSPARAATIIPVPQVPGSVATDARAINDNNVVVGDYLTPDGVEHGFFGTLDGNYTTFDYDAGGIGIQPRSINDDGAITGIANTLNGVIVCDFVPFERSPDGTIVTISKDGAPLDGIIQQIDNKGTFVGDYCEHGDGARLGYYGANGQYQGSVSGFTDNTIAPRGVSKNAIAGWFIPDNASNEVGFVLQTGILSVVSYPDPAAVDTFITSINKKNLATGGWDTGDGSGGNGFVLDLPNAKFIPVSVPGATFQQASGVNNAGVFIVDTDIGSFVYCLKERKCPSGGRHIPEAKPIYLAQGTFLHPDYRRLAARALKAAQAPKNYPRGRGPSL